MHILFDAMGVQVQVQEATDDRLTTWWGSLMDLGYTTSISDYKQPLVSIKPPSSQLDGVDVLVILTRQWIDETNIPKDTCFSFTRFGLQVAELAGIQSWVRNGGGLLLFTNHSYTTAEGGPYFPVHDIQLAGAFGISLHFTYFNPPAGAATLSMMPNPNAPPELIDGVATVEAWDSGGIVPFNGSSTYGTVILPLPAGATDDGGLGYSPVDHAFGVLYQYGKGRIIVLGHSGIAGNKGTPFPSPGQIGAADNLRFLNNCIKFLGS